MTDYEYEFRAVLKDVRRVEGIGPNTNWAPCEPSAADHMASLEGFEVRRRPVGDWEPYKAVTRL